MALPEPRLEPPEPAPIAQCAWCESGIYDGQEVVESDGELLCSMECWHEWAWKTLNTFMVVAEAGDLWR